jgi:hypothetical protein
MVLVMERFGYPDYLLAAADELIDGQYADRPGRRRRRRPLRQGAQPGAGQGPPRRRDGDAPVGHPAPRYS